MLFKLKKQNSEGFTIIEVLVVLAVAALILLIVLLAVPALQRNARNTNRKEDVGNIVAGINEYETDNNGSLPTNASSISNGTLTWQGVGTTTSTESRVSYYISATGTGKGAVNIIAASSVSSTGGAATANLDEVQVFEGSNCGTTLGNTVPGGLHSFAVLYEIENTSGSWQWVCQQS